MNEIIPGQIISHYRIIEKLGEGGMGVVYKAEDTILDRIVALKFLPSHISNQDLEKQRFIHEAKAASAIEHNNVCAIYEIGETENGQLFIAMSYIEGKTLREEIDNAPLKVEEVVDIAVQICGALKLAHEKGIVHRDIKPANVMIARDGTIKVMDFGLAKLGGKTRLTQMGTTLGTFSYMSPEQTHGEEVDHRADIWSLGVVLYEMLTGQLPFKGDYEQAVIYSILNEPPEILTAIRSGIPIELERIINKMLAKDPDERYQNMTDVIVDLRNLRKKSSISKVSSISQETAGKKHKPSLKWIAADAIIIIAAIAFLFIKPWHSSTNTIRSIAVLPLDNLSHNPDKEYFVDGMTNALISKLAQISSLRVISRTSVMQYKNIKKPISEIASELNVEALVEGTVSYENGTVKIDVQLIQADPEKNIWGRDYTRELENILQLQDDVARNIAEEINITVTPEEKLRLTSTEKVDPTAYDLYLKGISHIDKITKEDLQIGFDYLTKSLAIDPDFVLTNMGLAEYYLTLSFRNNFEEKTLSKFQSYAEKVLTLDNSLSQTYYLLGLLKFYKDSDVKGAEKDLAKALELNPNLADAQDLYCNVLLSLGKIDEAVSAREKAMKLDPLSHMLYCNGGFTYYFANQYDKAIDQANLTKEIFGPACAYEDLVIGMSYNQKGMHKEAINVLEKRRVKAISDLRIIAELGYAYALEGKKNEAKTLLIELKNTAKKRIGRPDYYNEALINIGLGNTEEVFSLLEKAADAKAVFMLWIDIDPRFEPIKADPRFQKIIDRFYS